MRPRILIVDDDSAILEPLEILLALRYEVTLATNGEEALDRLSAEPVDLIILDMLMPIMDGEEVMQELRRRRMGVPVIITSAHSELLASAQSLGASDSIRKPFTGDTLEKKIGRILGHEDPSGGSSRSALPAVG